LLGACLACASDPPPADPALRALAERVESVRGVPLGGLPPVEEIAPQEIPAILTAELDRAVPPARLAQEEALAKALGLLPDEVDLRRAILDYQAGALAGFYTPAAGRLYAVQGAGGAAAGADDSVWIHEISHWFQDQQGPLLQVTVGALGQDDLLFALGTLAEGDALWTEYADAEQQGGPPAPEPDVFASQFRVAVMDDANAPRIVREPLLAQYPLGYALAFEIVGREGAAGLREALLRPPISSEELLHPERYLDPELRRPVALFPDDPLSGASDRDASAGCRFLVSNSLGELGVRMGLREWGATDAAATAAADGWDGDRAWSFDCPGGAAVGWLVQMDDDEHAWELRRVLAIALDGPDAPPLAVWQRGPRVLIARDLPAPLAQRLLALPVTRISSLPDWLERSPEILERARRLRAAAAEE
jgi:hypothetical protein